MATTSVYTHTHTRHNEILTQTIQLGYTSFILTQLVSDAFR